MAETVSYIRKCFRKCFHCGFKMIQPVGRCWCGSQTFITHQEEESPMSDTAGRAPWRYECVGDSDGETVGYDHLVYDADGNELATAPNEQVGKLIAAAPSLLAVVNELKDSGVGPEWPEVAGRLWDMALNKAEGVLAQLAEPQVFWQAPAPDAVYTLEADLKRSVEDRAKLVKFVKSLANYEDIGHVHANAQCVLFEVEGGVR